MFITTLVAVFHTCVCQEARSKKNRPQATPTNTLSPPSPDLKLPKEKYVEEYSASDVRRGAVSGGQGDKLSKAGKPRPAQMPFLRNHSLCPPTSTHYKNDMEEYSSSNMWRRWQGSRGERRSKKKRPMGSQENSAGSF